jgi:hypothetical protein
MDFVGSGHPVRPRLRAILATSTVVIALTLAVGPAVAVTGWAGPTVILSGHHATQLHMGVATDGTIAILGRDETGLFHLTDRSGDWVRTKLAPRWATRDYPHDQIAGVFDRAGHAYLAWARACAGTDCSKAGIWHRDDASGSWSAPRRLVNGDVAAPAMQLIDGAIHLAYLDVHSRLRFRLLEDGGFVDGPVWSGKTMPPRMAIGAKGSASIVAFRLTETGADLWWAKRRLGGASVDFESRRVPGAVAIAYDFNRDPLIALDAHGRPHIAWTHETICGVPPCDDPPSDGAWLTEWTGSAWTKARHPSRGDAWAVRLTSAGRIRLLTDRPSLVRETAAGMRTTVLQDPAPSVMAGALALTGAGEARVVLAETVKVGGRWEGQLLLMRER